MGYDDVILHMGEFGRYQRRIYFALCLPAIICAFHEMGGVFLAAKTDFRCLLPQENPDNATYTLPPDVTNVSYPWDHKTKSWSRCERYDLELADRYNAFGGNLSASPIVKCDSFVYDKSLYMLTATTEWNLVCDKAWLRATGDSVFMVGEMLGSLIFGGLSDRYGRRATLFLVLIIQLVGGILVAVSPEYISYMTFRSIVGAATGGEFLVAYVIALEMVGPKKRLVAEIGFLLFFTSGYILVTGFAYFIPNWRTLQIAFTVPSIAFLAYWWLIPESIRWLLTQGRLEQAKDLFQKASLENGVELSQDTLDSLLTKDVESEPDLKQPSVFDLVRYPNLRKKSLLIFLMCLAGNEYVNFGLSAFVEVPAFLFLLFTLDRWGRKIILCACMSLGGVALLCTLFVPVDMPWMVVVFAMIGKFSITCSAAAGLVSASEQFPTVIRNVGLGTSGIFSRVGAIIAPYINLLAEVWTPMPLIIFGFCSLITGLLSLLLPETLNKKLPETIQDGEQFGKKSIRDIEKWNDLKIIQSLTAPKSRVSGKQNR